MLGWIAVLPVVLSKLDEVTEAIRRGGGVPCAAFGPELMRALERTTATSMRILLTRRWLPTIPDVVARLEEGGSRVADVGCGAGVAALTMTATQRETRVETRH